MITQGVKFLKSKDEAFMAFKHFKTEVLKEKKPEGGSRWLERLEFVNKVFLKYCKDEGIVMHNTIVRSPQQNGGGGAARMKWEGQSNRYNLVYT